MTLYPSKGQARAPQSGGPLPDRTAAQHANIMKLHRPISACTALLCLSGMGLLAAGCTESSPKRMDQKATVTTRADVEGRSFTDTSPLTTDEAAQPSEATSGRSTAASLDMTGASGGLGQQNVGMSSYLDAQLAAGLREDPGQTADGSIEGLVTFGDLSLLGADIDELLDYIYKPETERAKRFKFPERVLENAGENKAIVGYMIALDYKPGTDEIVSFMLVRDLQACCFGGVPRPDEWVMVEMEAGKTTDYHMYVPITVYGTFTPGRVEDEYGYAAAIYNLVASKVERYEIPPSK